MAAWLVKVSRSKARYTLEYLGIRTETSVILVGRKSRWENIDDKNDMGAQGRASTCRIRIAYPYVPHVPT